MKEYSSIHYDFKNKRSALFMNIVKRDEEHKLQVVSLCDAKDENCEVYVVDLKKNKCWTKKKAGGFRKACIPDDAKDLGEFSLGLKGVFKVHSYEVKKSIKRGFVEASVTVSVIDDGVCVPVGENISGVMKRVGFMQNVGFIDITAGIKNETVFDVPKQCEHGLDLNIEADFERDHFILAI